MRGLIVLLVALCAFSQPSNAAEIREITAKVKAAEDRATARMRVHGAKFIAITGYATSIEGFMLDPRFPLDFQTLANTDAIRELMWHMGAARCAKQGVLLMPPAATHAFGIVVKCTDGRVMRISDPSQRPPEMLKPGSFEILAAAMFGQP